MSQEIIEDAAAKLLEELRGMDAANLGLFQRLEEKRLQLMNDLLDVNSELAYRRARHDLLQSIIERGL